MKSNSPGLLYWWKFFIITRSAQRPHTSAKSLDPDGYPDPGSRQRSGSPQKTNHFFLGPFCLFPENFIKIKKVFFAWYCLTTNIDKQTNGNQNKTAIEIIDLAEVIIISVQQAQETSNYHLWFMCTWKFVSMQLNSNYYVWPWWLIPNYSWS